MKTIQYTVRGISERLNETLRKSAVREGKSLNTTLLEVLKRGLGLASEPHHYNDLDDLAGTWVEDPEFDRALQEMDTVDENLWK